MDEIIQTWVRAVCPKHGPNMPLSNNPTRCRMCWETCELRDVVVAGEPEEGANFVTPISGKYNIEYGGSQ